MQAGAWPACWPRPAAATPPWSCTTLRCRRAGRGCCWSRTMTAWPAWCCCWMGSAPRPCRAWAGTGRPWRRRRPTWRPCAPVRRPARRPLGAARPACRPAPGRGHPGRRGRCAGGLRLVHRGAGRLRGLRRPVRPPGARGRAGAAGPGREAGGVRGLTPCSRGAAPDAVPNGHRGPASPDPYDGSACRLDGAGRKPGPAAPVRDAWGVVRCPYGQYHWVNPLGKVRYPQPASSLPRSVAMPCWPANMPFMASRRFCTAPW